MEVVRKISSANNFGSYKSFSWDEESIGNFRRYNLLYGWNYSGKTTLSRMFAVMGGSDIPDGIKGEFIGLIENKEETTYEWNSNDEPTPLAIKVFNRDFINSNFSTDHNAPAVHILGENVQHIRDKIEKRDSQILRIDDSVQQVQSMKEDHETLLNGEKTSTARVINEVIGGRYDRRNLDSTLPRIRSNPANYLLDEEQVENLKRTLATASDYQSITIQKSVLPDINSFISQCHELLSRTATNQAIQALKKDSELENWLRTALNLHQETNTCRFCGGDIDQSIFESLRGHFDKEQEKLREDVNLLLNQIPELINYSIPQQSSIYPHLRSEYSKTVQELESWRQKFTSVLTTLRSRLQEKIEDNLDQALNLEVELPSTAEWNRHWEKLEVIKSTQNDLTNNTSTLISESKSKLEDHYVAKLIKSFDFESYEEKQDWYDSLLEKYSCLKQVCTDKISALEEEIRRSSVAVEKLNEVLLLMLPEGHIEVFPITENTFEFRRNGVAATNLSDGERTAVTFAYFLVSLEDNDQKLGETVVFIDDPISSLDSNHVYSVWALINQRLKTAKQLFVSTHNNELFTLIKDEWVHSRRAQQNFKSNHAGYWVSRYIDNQGVHQSKLETLPDLLRKSKSEYQFVFSLLYQFSENKNPTIHEAYTSPNLLRKFLEAYLGFRQPSGGGWKGKLDLLIDEEAKRKELYKFSDDASHFQKPTRIQEHPSYINNAQSICKEVLEALKKVDIMHYNSLCECL
jgi:wobble nucleotide-excising tRNase